MSNFDRFIAKILKEQATAPNPVQQALPIPATQTGQMKRKPAVQSRYAKVLPSQPEKPRPVPATKIVPKNSYLGKLSDQIRKSPIGQEKSKYDENV